MKSDGIRTQVNFYRDGITCNVRGHNPGVKPPPGSGERIHKGFNPKQRQRIARACECIATYGDSPYMLTLTYADPEKAPEPTDLPEVAGFRTIVPDAVALRDVDRFLKRMKYQWGPDVLYCWVAEIQPSRLRERHERAIHFHIVVSGTTPDKIHFETWARNAWNEVIRFRYRLNGNAGFWKISPDFRNFSHVQRADENSGRYLGKYFAKAHETVTRHLTQAESDAYNIRGNGYGMSRNVSHYLKPLTVSYVNGVHAVEVALNINEELKCRALPLRKVVAPDYDGPYSYGWYWPWQKSREKNDFSRFLACNVQEVSYLSERISKE